MCKASESGLTQGPYLQCSYLSALMLPAYASVLSPAESSFACGMEGKRELPRREAFLK